MYRGKTRLFCEQMTLHKPNAPSPLRCVDGTRTVVRKTTRELFEHSSIYEPPSLLIADTACSHSKAGVSINPRHRGCSVQYGLPKQHAFEHFLTPLGVFPHTLENPDFRSAGTFNKNHIRGYGLRGRRVFDFGWQLAERRWGKGGTSKMRLQMHATDPRILEFRLGEVASEGCISIPTKLNVFLDVHGVLDADYEAALAAGKSLWVLKPKRQTIPGQGATL